MTTAATRKRYPVESRFNVMTTEHAFVFAHLADYTALTEPHGEESAADLATRFHAVPTSTLRPRRRP